MASHFFSLFSRMKNINRWSLMRNSTNESLSQHSLEVAAISHALAVIGNKRLGKNYDASKAALLGIYHDMPEIITGDMPTPVKYYNKDIRRCFGEIEKAAQSTLLESLPEDLRSEYEELIIPDETTELYRLVKAADKISALIKCIEEKKTGNIEFEAAQNSTRQSIQKMNCEEADIFIDEFLDSFSLVLDNLLIND
ncbi:MAG: 5'-deoxynucleotidase [Clostridia bacterium]|nr:5'-deoxynucleotidase [Clostridia bacterium]